MGTAPAFGLRLQNHERSNMTTNHDPVQATIDEVDARRHNGNKLVNPPCRHLGGGRYETAVLDGKGGYHYLSDEGVPYAQHVNDFFTVR